MPFGIHCVPDGNRDWKKFAKVSAEFHNAGITDDEITMHIKKTAARKIDVAAAKSIIAKRGWTTAVNGDGKE